MRMRSGARRTLQTVPAGGADTRGLMTARVRDPVAPAKLRHLRAGLGLPSGSL